MRETRSSAAMPIPLESVLRFTGSSRVRREAGHGKAELRIFIGSLLLNLVLFATFLGLATPVYETNDDLGMQFIAAGFFDGHPDAHLVFTNALLGGILSMFYRTWQGVNWYWCYLVAVHFLSMTGITYVFLSRRRNWLSVLCLVGFFLVVETRVLLLLQFTTAAFMAGTSGLLLLVDGLDPQRPVNWPKTLAAIALLTLMGLIRDAVAFLLVVMALPFLLERFGWRGRFRLLTAGIACAFLFLIGGQMDRWYYRSDPAWSEFREYNRMRGEIQGTRLTQFAERAAKAAGWTPNDGGMFVDFFLSDPDVYGSNSRLRAFLGELLRIDSKEGQSRTNFNFFLPRLLGYHAAQMTALAMVAAFWLILTAGRFRSRWLVTFGVTYTTLLLLSYYLLSTSRLPERVACCFPILILAVCLYWLTVERPEQNRETVRSDFGLGGIIWPNVWRGVMAALVGVTVVYSGWLLSHQARTLWVVNARNRELKAVSRVIFSPVRALLPNGQKPVLIAMPYDSILEQCLIFYPARRDVPFTLVPYGWLSQSPPFRRLLSENGLKPFAISLLNRTDVFFLMEKLWINRLRVFYREHYGQEVEFATAYSSDGEPDYRGCQLHLFRLRSIRSQPPANP